MRFRLALFCLSMLIGPVVKADPAEPFVELDYARVERSIAREPRYIGAPRYALFVSPSAAPGRARTRSVPSMSTI
jgi:hypothetical protein